MYLLLVTSVIAQVFTSFNSLPKLRILNSINLKFPGILLQKSLPMNTQFSVVVEFWSNLSTDYRP